MKKIKLSVVILTYNSEKYIEKALQSCNFADEILVLDSGSIDNTLAIAQKYKANIYKQKWLGFGPQKQYAVNLTRNDWVFVLDSDEYITNELKDEIIKTLQNPKFNGYFVPRLNYFFGKPVKRCGLYPDKTIRLFNKNYGKFTEDIVHEKVIINGKVGILKNHIIHFAYENIEEFIYKQNIYSSLKKKPNKLKALINPMWTFFKMYILRLGFLEGWEGFIISKLYSQYTFWKYIKE